MRPEIKAIIEEELRLLEANRKVLLENPPEIGARDAEIVHELLLLREQTRTAKAEDLGAIHQQYDHLVSLLEQLREGRDREEVDPDIPYFAHLRLRERSSRDIYLGKATRLDNGLRIVDWRNAPVSRIYYLYEEGDEFEEEMGGRQREGVVEARRTLSIRSGVLQSISGSMGVLNRGSEGEWHQQRKTPPRLVNTDEPVLKLIQTPSLHHRLGQDEAQVTTSRKHLPDIAALIDPEQFQMIAQPDSGLVVIRGGAGSGKTTVALHRVAFLSYQQPERFRPDRIKVLVWGRALRDYIEHVLPALGMRGVEVEVYSQWTRRLMRRHFPFLPRRYREDTPSAVSRLKLHPAFLTYIETVQVDWDHEPTAYGVVDDWIACLSRPQSLRAHLLQHAPHSFSRSDLDEIFSWHRSQRAGLISWMEGDRSQGLALDPQDDALLLRLYQLRVGPLRSKKKKQPLRYAHLVIDEVQDLAPIELKVATQALDERQSVTLSGDTQQHILEGTGFLTWDSILPLLEISAQTVSTLQVSYRSTEPIARFAREVLGELAEDDHLLTTRSGQPVEFFQFTDHGACVAFLADSLKRLIEQEPLASVALLTPDSATSALYFDGLQRAELSSLRRVFDQRFAFAPGVDVTEVTEVKGLEFDYVVLIEVSAFTYRDTDYHRRLLHVGATRAAHQLWMTSVGTPSPILREIRSLEDQEG